MAASASAAAAALRNAAEPGLIAIALIGGAVINSRDPRAFFAFWRWAPVAVPKRSTHGHPPRTLPAFGYQIPVPDTTKYRGRPLSRFLWHAPFLMEIWYWNLAYWSYQLARAFSAVHLSPTAPQTATRHALSLLALERALHIDIELRLQRLVLALPPAVMAFLGHVYYSHIVLGCAFVAYLYTYRPDVFQRVRRTQALANGLAFVVLSVWRVAPPRLLPEEEGFVDVLHSGQKHSAWTQNRFQLVYAAMPSLHFGNALLLGTTLFLCAPHRPLRLLAPLWPILMLLTIIATANHFVLDALVGALVPLLAFRLNRVMLALRPLEEWGFWACGAEKPPPAWATPPGAHVGERGAEEGKAAREWVREQARVRAEREGARAKGLGLPWTRMVQEEEQERLLRARDEEEGSAGSASPGGSASGSGSGSGSGGSSRAASPYPFKDEGGGDVWSGDERRA